MVNENNVVAANTPKAIFMMGAPGSGKSYIRKRDFAGLTVIDCDEIKAEHPDFDINNPSALHEWSSQEATRRFFAALGTGHDVVFDGTGNTAEKYVSFIQAAHAAGYSTELVFVTTDLQTALARNANRRRVVPETVVRDRFARISVSFEIVSRYADSVRIIRN